MKVLSLPLVLQEVIKVTSLRDVLSPFQKLQRLNKIYRFPGSAFAGRIKKVDVSLITLCLLCDLCGKESKPYS